MQTFLINGYCLARRKDGSKMRKTNKDVKSPVHVNRTIDATTHGKKEVKFLSLTEIRLSQTQLRSPLQAPGDLKKTFLLPLIKTDTDPKLRASNRELSRAYIKTCPFSC